MNENEITNIETEDDEDEAVETEDEVVTPHDEVVVTPKIVETKVVENPQDEIINLDNLKILDNLDLGLDKIAVF